MPDTPIAAAEVLTAPVADPTKEDEQHDANIGMMYGTIDRLEAETHKLVAEALAHHCRALLYVGGFLALAAVATKIAVGL